MNLFDGALGLVAVMSVIIGAMRGFVKEAAALAGWIVAVVLVLNSSVPMGQRLPFGGLSTGARTAIAAILIVIVCVLVAHLAGRMLRGVLTAAQLGGPDRALGALFGVARAAAVWLLMAGLVIHFGLTEMPFWRTSRAAPWLEAALRLISPEIAPSAHRPLAARGV